MTSTIALHIGNLQTLTFNLLKNNEFPLELSIDRGGPMILKATLTPCRILNLRVPGLTLSVPYLKIILLES